MTTVNETTLVSSTYYNLTEAMEKLKVSKPTIYKWSKNGRLNCIIMPNGFKCYDVDEFIKNPVAPGKPKEKQLSENEDDKQITTVNTFIVEDDQTGQLIFKSDLTNSKELRIFGTYEEPLFVAKDVAEMLGYKDTKKAIEDNVEEYDKLTYEQYKMKGVSVSLTPFILQDSTILITESGLYSLILRSKLKRAKEFQRWVTKEVLPSIRKKGEFVMEDYKKKIEAQQKIIEEKSKQLESTKKDLVQEQNSCISAKKSLLQSQTKFSQRYEFPCKPAIYILENPNQLVKEYKFGKSENMNTRLRQDRTMIPDIKVRLIMYTQHYSLFENVIRTHFAESLVQPSHEWIHEEILEDIIKACVDIDKLCNFQSETETNLWRYNLEDPPGHREPYVIPRLKTKLKKQGKSSTTSSSSQEVKVCTKLFETMAEVLPTYLIRAEYKKKNADAQPGQRWCNGYCANYRDISKFSMCSISPMTICQLCESMIDIAQIKINSGEMTAKQIRENPSLILIRDGEQLCRKCSKILPVEDFFQKIKIKK